MILSDLRPQPIPFDKVDWQRAAQEEIDPMDLLVLFVLSKIEHATHDIYFNSLLTPEARRHLRILTFLGAWRIEERRHGEQIQRYLQQHGMFANPTARDARVYRVMLASRFGSWLLQCLIRRQALAVHMHWGAINEASAAAVYKFFVDKYPGTELAILLKRIMSQEVVHRTFYADQANLLTPDRYTRWLVRTVIRFAWEPVGSGVCLDEEIAMVTRQTLRDPVVVRAVDADLERQMPALKGLKLLTRSRRKLMRFEDRKVVRYRYQMTYRQRIRRYCGLSTVPVLK